MKNWIPSLFLLPFLYQISCVSLKAQDETWSNKSPITTGRGFVSGAVVDGKIYIIGGFPDHNSVTASVEMYDPVSDVWITRSPIPGKRHTFFLGAVRDTIYAAGGSNPDPENPNRAIIPATVFGYNVASEY